MKRFLVALAISVCLCSSVVNAEMQEFKDDFTGKDIHRSAVILPEGIIKLSKLEGEYQIEFTAVSRNSTYLINRSVQTRIDDQTTTIGVERLGTPTNLHGSVFSTIYFKIPREVVEKIPDAERVALKFALNIDYCVVVIPAKVLNEWKELIKMQE